MELRAFRIRNFRSIVDTGWCPFSRDRITVLVGQNESGKSSILDALATTFSDLLISDDDCRISAPLPIVDVCLEVDPKLLLENLDMNPPEQVAVLEAYLAEKKNILDYSFTWIRKSDGSGLTCEYDIDNGALAKLLQPFEEAAKLADEKALAEATAALENETVEEGQEKPQPKIKEVDFLSIDDVVDTLFGQAPDVTLFEEESGLLPNRIDVVQNKEGGWSLSGEGSKAAANFLQIAGIELEGLVRGDARTREHILRKANAKLTADFAQFWSQTIGKKEKLQLECDIANYGTEAPKKAGEPHLVFWISDGFNKLYPKQRSQGVRWFVSFYLQLKASQSKAGSKMFLLDEPGANLHAKAQADVLKLINRLSGDVLLVYSTHSPTLIEYEKLYRVLAIQRDGEEGDSPTTVITAHKLGAASKDTLLPLFAAMGADLSQQQVIQKKANVLLEEISGFYYFKSIWTLIPQKQEAYFIAATGANNVEPLANMFLGWGLDFIAVFDDDPTGRGAYNQMKRHVFGDSDDIAKANMLKIPDCRGIEDLFSVPDFQKFVLESAVECPNGNSQYVKDSSLSKPVLAYKFWIKVSNGEVKFKDFDEETKGRMTNVAKEIAGRLQAKAKK